MAKDVNAPKVGEEAPDFTLEIAFGWRGDTFQFQG